MINVDKQLKQMFIFYKLVVTKIEITFRGYTRMFYRGVAMTVVMCRH